MRETGIIKNNDDEDDDIKGISSLKRLFLLLKPHIPMLIFCFLITLSLAGISMAIPKMIGEIIDNNFNNFTMSKLNEITLQLLVLIFLMAALRYTSTYYLGRVGATFLRRFREKVFDHIIYLSLSFFHRRQAGELNARIMANIESIQQMLTNNALTGIQSIVQLVGVVIMLFYINISITLVAMAVCIPMAALSFFYGRVLETSALKVNDTLANSSANVEEVLNGISTVQAFAKEKHESSRYKKLMEKHFGASISQIKQENAYFTIMNMCGYSALVVVIWFGGRQILSDQLSMGDLSACLMYMVIFAVSVEEVAMLVSNIGELNGVSHRIFQLLDTRPEVKDNGVAIVEKSTPLRINFVNVSFAYPSDRNKMVLKDISLEIKEGDEIAIVGPSGSGKTTIFKLLLRFYEKNSGNIKLNGKNISEYSLDSVRNLFGIVSQDIFLFTGTVLENITYGNSQASIEDVENAIKSIGAADFIASLKNGIYEQVGVGGSKLSGGQKQLLGIARIYLKNPRVLLLDEATSSLDSESEEKVQNSLKKLKKDRTTIVIAHRLATVRDSKKIVLLDGGRFIAEGSHEYLQKNSELYSRYWQWQSRGAGLSAANL